MQGRPERVSYTVIGGARGELRARLHIPDQLAYPYAVGGVT